MAQQQDAAGMNVQQLMQAIQSLQQGQTRLQEQLQRSLTESQQMRDANVVLTQRLQQAETEVRQVAAVNEALRQERAESMEVLKLIPKALESIGGHRDRKNLFDSKGLGKPQTLGDEQAELRFRLWSIKLEDYVAGVFGEKFREAMQWASESEVEVSSALLANTYGEHADPNDVIEDIDDMNTKLYSALRSTTEGTPFDVVDNTSSNSGLEAWRLLHRKYDPATGGRKRVMLNALTTPDRATYETLAGALERWRALRARYNRKKDQFGKREELPESLAMNALEKLVPKDLEQHLQLNYTRFKTYDQMEEEVRVFVEAKTGAKMTISNNFSQSSSEAVPMDVGALIDAVRGIKDIGALIKSSKGNKGKAGGKGTGDGKRACYLCGKTNHLAKDCWSKSSKGKGKGKDSSFKGKGKTSSSRSSSQASRFQGRCNNCGKEGHKAKDCWSKGSGKGKDAKGNSRGVNALNQEPEKEAEAGGLDLCHLSSDLCDGWLRLNYDTGAAITALPKVYKSESVDSGQSDRPFKTASGERLDDLGKATITGVDESGHKRRVTGHVTDVHKVLLSASSVHKKGFDTWLGSGGGRLIDHSSRLYKELCKTYSRFGGVGEIPLYEERGVYNLYLRVGESGSQSKVESDSRSLGSVEKPKKKVSWADLQEEEETELQEPALAPLEEGELVAVEEPVEARRAIPAFDPGQPTQKDIDEHEASGHAVYRAWCPQCIEGWGLGQRHMRQDHEEETVSVVSHDFFYMSPEEDDNRPFLAMIDRKTKMVFATALDNKKARNEASLQQMRKFYELLGYKKFISKSDGEPAMRALKREAAAGCGDITIIPQESPPGDHKANGEVESCINDLKRRMRANKSGLEKRLGQSLPEDHVVWSWLPRYCSDMINRYKVGTDGQTPEERRTGKQWKKPVPLFGERIMYKAAGSSGKRSDAAARMQSGHFVGLHNRFGSVLVLTKQGVRVGSSFHRLSEAERWSIDGWSELMGTPWKIHAIDDRKLESSPMTPAPMTPALMMPATPVPVSLHETAVQVDAAEDQEHVSPRSTAKAKPVKRAFIEKFGATPGCDGCYSVKKGKMIQQIQHSAECRARIYKRIQEEQDEKQIAEDKRARIDEPSSPSKRKAEVDVEVLEGQSSSSASRPSRPPAALTRPDSPKRPAEVDIETLVEQTMAEEATTLPTETPTDAVASFDLNSLEFDIDHSYKAVQKRILEEMIEQQFVKEGVDYNFSEVQKIATLSASICSVDVMEIFSPSRFTSLAACYGLQRGVAVDLNEMKPDGSDMWDLDRKRDRLELEAIIENEEPWLVTGSPPCGPFSSLRSLSDYKRDPTVVAEEIRVGKERVKTSVQMYKKQYDAGRYFLHEHPELSKAWDMPEVKELESLPGVYRVRSTMCCWKMVLKGREQEGYVRKPTVWLTNSKKLAEVLNQICGETTPCLHRHVRLIGGVAKQAQVYPDRLVRAVLQGLREQLLSDRSLSSFESLHAGPSPHEELWNEEEFAQQEEEFIDAAAGVLLDPQMVQKARAEELKWVKDEKIYDRVPLSQCLAVTGREPISTKWVDINKGDDQRPLYRSRWVAREIKKKKAPGEQLSEVELFAATPPVEIFYLICSMLMTQHKGRARDLRLGSWDVSRAHFMGTVERDLFISLPPEDLHQDTDTEPMCGKLNRSMYGTQDASRIFQKDWNQVLANHDFEIGKLCPATFKHKTRNMWGMVHGDDFLVLANDVDLQFMDSVLRSKYKVRWEATLGLNTTDDKQMFFLNRLVQLTKRENGEFQLEVEADARHSELIVKQLNLHGSKGSDVPEVKVNEVDFEHLKKQSLNAEDTKLFRSLTMRTAYLSQDRPDLANTAKNLARGMSQPKVFHFEKLKKLGRYLVKHPYGKRIFRMQYMKQYQLIGFTDSDWACDLETRRSTTGVAVMAGQHLLLTKSNLQSVVSLSSAEAEYYGICKGAISCLFLKHLLEEWSIPCGLTMKCDSTAARAIACRVGVGKTKHVQARFLWLQQHTRDGVLTIEKVDGTKNNADLMTKILSRQMIDKHLKRMNFVRFECRNAKQKALLVTG